LRCHPKCYGFPIPINTIQLVYIKHSDPSIHVSVFTFLALKGSHMKYWRRLQISLIINFSTIQAICKSRSTWRWITWGDSMNREP
jgi:hypothetical protein